MPQIFHALGLSFHQPMGNMLALHNSQERWEIRQILWCYERTVRLIEEAGPAARLHLMMSGTLLKQLEDPAITETFGDVVNIPEMLAAYQRCQNIEFCGTGLYHPVLPLIPREDWPAQVGWWQGLGRKLLGREWFPGFCPPEIAACQELVPVLRANRYRYLLVDCWYIKPRREMRWEELRYRPHIVRHEGQEIVVVPIDRELSNAQNSGMDPWWFEYELVERTRWCDFPALVTTWSDGENGGWFRNPNLDAGFWGHFHRPVMARHYAGELAYTPVSINEYLDRFGPGEEVDLHPGAWNTGHHWGGDFMQWTGSLLQKRGFDEIRNASRYWHATTARFARCRDACDDAELVQSLITQAYDELLLAETSCNFFWGSKWVYKTFDGLELVYRLLDEAAGKMPAEEPAGQD